MIDYSTKYSRSQLKDLDIYKPIHFLMIAEFQNKHNLSFDEVIDKLINKKKEEKRRKK